jgi:hypothetical protein
MRRITALSSLLLALVPTASALINPKFTPVDLVEQAGQILQVEVGPADAGGGVPVRLVKCLKGAAPKTGPTLDLSQTAKPQADALRETVGREGKQLGLLFIGKLGGEGGDGGAGEQPAEKAVGFLSVRGLWFRLVEGPNGAWLLDARDDQMQSCWAGGTDMLLRAVDYIQAEPHAAVPAKAGVVWGEKKKAAKLEGKAHGMVTVSLVPTLPPPKLVPTLRVGTNKSDAPASTSLLHVLCESGDRLFQWDAAKETPADVTEKHKLAARSQAAAWGDFNADGRLDLASWDGRSLRFHLQKEDGTFEAKDSGIELKEGCIGLSVLDVGVKGRMGILVSTRALPVLLLPGPGGAFARNESLREWATPGFSSLGFGAARACLVADFDGDAVADILQPFEKGALFYKGIKPGAFAPPNPLKGIGTGPGTASAFLGDYDADGLLDVFVAAEEGCRIWQNLGGGRFEEALGCSGEAAYITKPKAFGGATGDVNNDGRQDFLVLYEDRPPHVFFNRGFRSFGHAHELDIEEHNLLPEAAQGQQAGILTDFDGDGAQDLALVLANGEFWVILREAEPQPVGVRVSLPVGGPWGGPVTVAGACGRQALGAWNVIAGAAEAFFARPAPGPIQIRWQFPGDKPQERTVEAKAGSVQFRIGAE